MSVVSPTRRMFRSSLAFSALAALAGLAGGATKLASTDNGNRRFRGVKEGSTKHGVAEGRFRTIENGGHVGRNGACPCASGQKFKNCCKPR